MFQAGSDIARRLVSKRGNRKFALSLCSAPAPATQCEPPSRRDTNKASDKSYKIYRCMIIETELTDENPSHWPSSIVPNTSFSVY